MISTIRTTVHDALRDTSLASYSTDARVEHVISVLENRDETIAGRLFELGVTDFEVPEGEMQQYLVELGLRAPRPVAVASNGHGESDDGEAPQWARQIIDRLDRMASFASQYGYRD